MTHTLPASGLLASGLLGSGLLASGLLASGLLTSGLLASGLLTSGLLTSGLLASGLLSSRTFLGHVHDLHTIVRAPTRRRSFSGAHTPDRDSSRDVVTVSDLFGKTLYTFFHVHT